VSLKLSDRGLRALNLQNEAKLALIAFSAAPRLAGEVELWISKIQNEANSPLRALRLLRGFVSHVVVAGECETKPNGTFP
jgi:hypothetical protein